MPGQAAVTRPPTVMEQEPEPGSVPNTSDDKIDGIFERNDLVFQANVWSREYVVLTPVNDMGLVEIIATCGCGGKRMVPIGELIHSAHHH